MDLFANISDTRWFSGHRHRQWYMHSVGRLRQLCCTESNEFVYCRSHISGSVDGDDVLLLKDCLRTEEKGNSDKCSLNSTVSTLLLQFHIVPAPSVVRLRVKQKH